MAQHVVMETIADGNGGRTLGSQGELKDKWCFRTGQHRGGAPMDDESAELAIASAQS